MNKSFPFSQKAINQSLIFGGVLLACGIAIVFLGRLNVTAMTFGLLLILMGLWQKKNSPVILLDDHLILKQAPIAPKRMILYSDIQSLGGDLTRRAFLMVNDAGKEKKIVLPFQALSVEDRLELVNVLQSKLKKN
ncbi:MAG TPA: hypothetical protein VNZ86_19370 [Bacteroidia bacterium]|jgi:hypothetical protein|nr:hypothetical protein [Bacteroidia bacterium]